MPELPDVEGHRRLFAAHAEGRSVDHVEVPDPELLEGTTPQGLGRSLQDRRFLAPVRHGKWLFAPTDGGPTLAVHFRMTGALVWALPEEERSSHDAVLLAFDDGELRYRTQRRLGRLHVIAADDDPTSVTGELGPDALEVDRGALATVLQDRRGMVKTALMDQRRVAGLGNELVDEMLWRARLHPRARARALDDDEVAALHRELREVLRRSVRAGHVPSGPTWLNGQRDVDDPRCPRCEAELERDQIGGRTTFWCPREQRL